MQGLYFDAGPCCEKKDDKSIRNRYNCKVRINVRMIGVNSRCPEGLAGHREKTGGVENYVKIYPEATWHKRNYFLFATFIIYALECSLPTSYVERTARELATKPGSTKSAQQWIDELNAQYGMDKGLVQGILLGLEMLLRENLVKAGTGQFRLQSSLIKQYGIVLF